MTKTIDTLVEDIYALFSHETLEFNSERVGQFGQRLGEHITNRIRETQKQPVLRLSNIGTECTRKLWYSINKPDTAEPLSKQTRFKFLFGDILEELLLFLAEEAGHSVEGRQTTLTINGVEGHRDAIIDGRLVDVKSASTMSYRKFESNGLRGNDPFNYLDQLGSYLAASANDPLLLEKDVASFLVVDKTLGNICLDTYPKTDVDYHKKVDDLREMLKQPEPPAQAYLPVPDGKSGNMKLGTQCSYCSFKHECFPKLRTFLYASGPTFLTHVERTPKVVEVTKDGTIIAQEEETN